MDGVLLAGEQDIFGNPWDGTSWSTFGSGMLYGDVDALLTRADGEVWLGGAFVERIAGSYTGVVGLPVFETASLLEAVGIDILAPIDEQ